MAVYIVMHARPMPGWGTRPAWILKQRFTTKSMQRQDCEKNWAEKATNAHHI